MGISCKKAIDFISKKEEGKLTLMQQLQLWQHFLICRLCKLFYKQNKVILSSLSLENINKGDSLSETDKKSIIRSMEELGNKSNSDMQ
jgi:hypothetical protein